MMQAKSLNLSLHIWPA